MYNTGRDFNLYSESRSGRRIIKVNIWNVKCQPTYFLYGAMSLNPLLRREVILELSPNGPFILTTAEDVNNYDSWYYCFYEFYHSRVESSSYFLRLKFGDLNLPYQLFLNMGRIHIARI